MRRLIEISSIVIKEDRQRREFLPEELNDLTESIQARGLLHPIVLRVEGENYVLVAGERRLRAMQDIYALGGGFSYDTERVPAGFAPYSFLGDLSELEAEEAELDENIRRATLTWQERAKATSHLEDLRKRQAESKGLPAPHRLDIVKEVRGSVNANDQTEVRADILISQHLHRPEVAKAKNAKEALKVLKVIERQERNVVLARSIGKTLSSASHTLLNEDSLAWMAKTPEGVFDVILTDPPYGMGADEFGDSGGRAAGAHGYKDDYETFMRCVTALAFEGFRITKPQAHMYCFCDFDKFSQVKALMAEAGWNVFRTPLIWFKPNGQRAPWPENGPQRKYECILFAEKGKKKITQLKGDVLEHPTEANLGHSAQKPIALYRDLLNRSCNPGDRVLDGFAGTGPILPAAHDLKCFATAIEMDEGSYAIAATRLKGLV